jgi:hypothetical protein
MRKIHSDTIERDRCLNKEDGAAGTFIVFGTFSARRRFCQI